MSFARYLTLVRTYGTDPVRWPGDERELFDRYAATPDGRAALAAEARFEALLDSDKTPAVASLELLARVCAVAARAGGTAWEARLLKVSGWSFAACLVAGLWLGVTVGRGMAGAALDPMGLVLFGVSPW